MTAERVRLAREYRSILSTTWDLDDFHEFFMPKKIAELARARAGGPIVIVNVFDFCYDALVIYQSTGQIVHVPLPALTAELAELMLTQFHDSMKQAHAQIRSRASTRNFSNESRSDRGALRKFLLVCY